MEMAVNDSDRWMRSTIAIAMDTVTDIARMVYFRLLSPFIYDRVKHECARIRCRRRWQWFR